LKTELSVAEEIKRLSNRRVAMECNTRNCNTGVCQKCGVWWCKSYSK